MNEIGEFVFHQQCLRISSKMNFRLVSIFHCSALLQAFSSEIAELKEHYLQKKQFIN
jgi:hypothetical protein